jgi:hypothetical protein
VPHYSKTPRFARDFRALPQDLRIRFWDTVRDEFIPDLEKGKFRAGLRVKRIQHTEDVFEMTFAPDGRATWQYGPEIEPGVPHVIWRRIGKHSVLNKP